MDRGFRGSLIRSIINRDGRAAKLLQLLHGFEFPVVQAECDFSGILFSALYQRVKNIKTADMHFDHMLVRKQILQHLIRHAPRDQHICIAIFGQISRCSEYILLFYLNCFVLRQFLHHIFKDFLQLQMRYKNPYLYHIRDFLLFPRQFHLPLFLEWAMVKYTIAHSILQKNYENRLVFLLLIHYILRSTVDHGLDILCSGVHDAFTCLLGCPGNMRGDDAVFRL